MNGGDATNEIGGVVPSSGHPRCSTELRAPPSRLQALSHRQPSVCTFPGLQSCRRSEGRTPRAHGNGKQKRSNIEKREILDLLEGLPIRTAACTSVFGMIGIDSGDTCVM